MKIIERIKNISKDHFCERAITIGFIGDSVTQGCFEVYRNCEKENGITTQYRSSNAYHNKLKKIFETVYPEVPVNIINAGISGDNSMAGYERLHRDIISFNPDLAVVCFGFNDVSRGADAINIYTESLDKIFCALSEAEIETIFMTPNMMNTYALYEEQDKIIHEIMEKVAELQNLGVMDMYMDAAREICKRHNIPVCDCYAKWKKLYENGVDVTRLLSIKHPTDEMHWLFASSLFEKIMGF